MAWYLLGADPKDLKLGYKVAKAAIGSPIETFTGEQQQRRQLPIPNRAPRR